jgi:nonsense-mediated mRNA decay protein 3
MSFLLKKINGIPKDVKVVEADFVYTEEHSMRLKVRLTVQKELYAGAILQQQFIVEFIVQGMQCPDCAQSYTEHQWNVVVQVRQKVRHKRTFFFLEQLLLKHGICQKCIGIKEENGGLDFHWTTRNTAQVLTQFLQSVVPVRTSESKRLISHNEKDGTAHFKFTVMVEIVPLCRNDLVILPKATASAMGGITQPLLVYKVNTSVHLIDPTNLRVFELSGAQYWRTPFAPIMTSNQMIDFTILDVEREEEYTQRGQTIRVQQHSQAFRETKQFHLAECEVARSSDFGMNDNTTRTITHLGHVLRVGDNCLGYMPDNTTIDTGRNTNLPEIILVKKNYVNRKNRAGKRKFKLKELIKADQENNRSQKSTEKDLEDFMQELEEDTEMRGMIDIYKNDSKRVPMTDNEDSDDGFPEIQMDELLDEMANMGGPLDAPADAADETAMVE